MEKLRLVKAKFLHKFSFVKRIGYEAQSKVSEEMANSQVDKQVEKSLFSKLESSQELMS